MKKFIQTMLNPHFIIGLFLFIVSMILAHTIPTLILFNHINGYTEQWYIFYPYLVILVGMIANFAFDLSFKKQSDAYKSVDILFNTKRPDLSGAGKGTHDRSI